MYRRQDYQFNLPDDLIAQYPSEKRDQSRLLVLNRHNGKIQNDHFYNIINYFKSGDCLIINDTKVIPARLQTLKKETGAKIEVLLLKPLKANRWSALLNPASKIKIGTILLLNSVEIEIIRKSDDKTTFEIEFKFDGHLDALIDQYGHEPLPPYIKRESENLDKNRYQTVYAKSKGAIAAPTAGLHFTPELLTKILEKGVHVLSITLHVGLGTFLPVKVDNIVNHNMHTESYSISKANAKQVNTTMTNQSGRIIAVGTTSLRCLEASMNKQNLLNHGSGQTNIFIYPGYDFKCVDCLLTNFHTAESTLLMLVSAFAGYEHIKSAYQYAVGKRYRFFSYGDAMLITY